jgi:hypothetical protein
MPSVDSPQLGAGRWLERYLAESSPSLADFADVVASPAGRLDHENRPFRADMSC